MAQTTKGEGIVMGCKNPKPIEDRTTRWGLHFFLALVALAAAGCGSDGAQTGEDSGVIDTSAPEADQQTADVQGLDEGSNDSATGDSAIGDSGALDSATGDSAIGDSGALDTVHSDSVLSDSGIPDSSILDSTELDSTELDSTAPDSARADASEFDGSGLDSASPDAVDPDSTAADATPQWPVVVLNEVSCAGADWVELVGVNLDGPVSLAGWSLTDDTSNPSKSFIFPEDVWLAPGEWLVFGSAADAGLAGAALPFGLKCGEETVSLLRPDGAVVDTATPPTPGADGATWGRLPDGAGDWGPTAATMGAANSPWIDWQAALYNPLSVAEIDLVVPPSSLASLWNDPYTYVPGEFRITVNGAVFGPLAVEVRLKGRIGSFRTLNSKAAFKVKLNPGKNGGSLFGLERLTLNNMVQDSSMLHETVVYRILRAFGVAASRTGYAWVRVNGRDYGLYLNLETYDDEFCDANFESTQHLYEGAYGNDVTPGGAGAFDMDEGDESDRSDLEALIAAANAPAGDSWTAGMSSVADLVQMRKVWAAEIFCGHWDGYAPTINNYYLHSNSDGVFSMMTSGADQTFGQWLDWFEGNGRLFSRCMQSADCRADYELEMAYLAELVADLNLDPYIVELQSSLAPWVQADPRRPYSVGQVNGAVQSTRDYLAGRTEDAILSFGCQLTGDPDPDNDGFSCATDCDNDNPDVHPGVEDVCGDGIDNDCDGFTDSALGCPDWEELIWEGKRYLISATPRPYGQARAHCQSAGSDMVVLDSPAEAAWLRAHAPALGKSSFWIGLNDLGLEGTYLWVDGSPLSYATFQSGEPNNWGGNEDCMEWYTNGFWNDLNCGDSRPVICEDRCLIGVDGDGDLYVCGEDCDDHRPAVYPGAVEVCLDGIDQDCNGIVDDGVDCPADGDCIGIPGGPFPSVYCATPTTWQHARGVCIGLGGDLVWFDDVNEHAWFMSALTSTTGGGTDVWFGLSDQAAEGAYRWVTGEAATYSTWAAGQPNNAGEQDCVRLLANGQWNDTACSAPLAAVCRLESSLMPISAPPICTPNCGASDGGDSECGDDGCGGICGACEAGEFCVGGHCVPPIPIADPPDSCQGFCGGSAPGGCWCDDACTGFGDCCSDYAQYCLGAGGGCAAVCGQMSPLGCYCDALCETYHDCCEDYAAACGGGCGCSGDAAGSAQQCGDDGCGTSCGECAGGDVCTADGQCVPADSGAGCAASDAPGCDSCPCEACVCQSDPYCCYVSWDADCAAACAVECPGQNACLAP